MHLFAVIKRVSLNQHLTNKKCEGNLEKSRRGEGGQHSVLLRSMKRSSLEVYIDTEYKVLTGIITWKSGVKQMYAFHIHVPAISLGH